MSDRNKNTSEQSREEEIICLAKRVLALVLSKDMLGADIDAQFLFRFDQRWCAWVSKIRFMMRELIKLPGEGPLPSKEGTEIWVHLDMNRVTRCSMTLGDRSLSITQRFKIEGHYHCYNDELRQSLDRAIESAFLFRDDTEMNQVWPKVWMEANQTLMLQTEMVNLALAYGLIPSESETNMYSLDAVRRMYQAVVSWVIRGEIVPSFRRGCTQLYEQGDGKERYITLEPNDGFHKNSEDKSLVKRRGRRKGLTLKTRVRIWTVHYLTRRGGGRLTETEATALWNQSFDDTLDPVHFREDRLQLFGGKPSKSAPKNR